MDKKDKSFTKTKGWSNTEYVHYSGMIDGCNQAVSELNAKIAQIKARLESGE